MCDKLGDWNLETINEEEHIAKESFLSENTQVKTPNKKKKIQKK